MYIPEHFLIRDPDEVLSIIRSYSFASLITCNTSSVEPEVDVDLTLVPVIVTSEAPLSLAFHIAARNPQARSVPSTRASLLFTGPHCYISPSWYEEVNAVPTWNYVAVQLSGKIEPIQDPEQVRDILDRTAEVYESEFEEPWSADWSNPYMHKMIEHIACYHMNVERVQAKAKLSQNHSLNRQIRVIARLKEGTPDEQAIASRMESNVAPPE
jgi:transcriptional regulator